MADSQQASAGPHGDRHFGYWAGHFVVVASMIGAGILTSAGFTLKDTGNPAGLLGIWVLGGFLALCGAVTVAELATTLPRSGGDYVFVRAAYGQGAAFVCGWSTFVLGFAAPTAVVAHLALGYLTGPFPGLPEWIVPVGATALILFVTVIHTLGAKHSALFQVAATLTKMAILVAIAVGGILFGKGDWNHLSVGHVPTGSEWSALALGLVYVGYGYAGWNAAAYMAGEIREPNKLLPRALIFGTLTVIVLYVLVTLAYIFALDPAFMQGLSYKDDFRQINQVAETAVNAMFGREVANAVSVFLGLSLVASVSAYVLAGPRVAYAMAKDNVFPGFAGRLHATRRTPVGATLAQAGIAIALVWAGSFRDLLSFTSAGLSALMALTVASIFPLRRRPALERPYRIPLFPLPPILFVLFIAGTVGYTVYDEMFGFKPKFPGPVFLSMIVLLIGIPLARFFPGGADTGLPGAKTDKA